MSQGEFFLTMENMTKDSFCANWKLNLSKSLLPEAAIGQFIEDKEFGLEHSWAVFTKANELTKLFTAKELEDCDFPAMEQIAVFHDIGKFFQVVHTADNPEIGRRIYLEFAQEAGIDTSTQQRAADGIRYHDFYNYELDPHIRPPNYMEGELIRAADKMLDNLIAKVDRYWNYGKQRGVPFYDPRVTVEDRVKFNFSPHCEVKTDELTYLLTLLALKPDDFRYVQLQQAYRDWSRKLKEEVIKRVLSLAQEEGFDKDTVANIISTYLKSKNIKLE